MSWFFRILWANCRFLGLEKIVFFIELFWKKKYILTTDTCVSNYIIEDNKSLKLVLEKLGLLLIQLLVGVEPPEPVVGVLVALHKQLEGAHLNNYLN